MSKDRSLDEFLGGAAESKSAAEPDSTADPDAESTRSDADVSASSATAARAAADGTAGVDAAEPTFRWSPSGATCDACGGSAARRWLDGGRYVCRDCKEW
ncbi:DUF7573 domain-containing protein [Halegenticoccus tardaugens]|uniref:DUF7573 domain-containing protein n=1 Tax=Halegenticoccus tardaugens TaxID=2071624 RepID=UPI0013E9508E|nr:hypothetical protein [Halegenticoccus tardaugens]